MSDHAACGHTKIKEVRWLNDQHSTSSKFMCLDCNTDFVQMTPEIRRIVNTLAVAEAAMADPSGKGSQP